MTARHGWLHVYAESFAAVIADGQPVFVDVAGSPSLDVELAAVKERVQAEHAASAAMQRFQDAQATYREQVADRQRQLEAFRAGTSRHHTRARLGTEGKTDVTELVYPNGRKETVRAGAADQAITAAFDQRIPVPRPPTAPAAPSVQLEHGRFGWVGDLVTAGNSKRLFTIETGQEEVPLDVLASTLDSLADDGWSLTSVSEDRALTRGDVTVPVTMRYLLTGSR